MSSRLTIDHPDVECTLRTGYPSWMLLDEDDFDQDAGEAFGDEVYEERRANEICGD